MMTSTTTHNGVTYHYNLFDLLSERAIHRYIDRLSATERGLMRSFSQGAGTLVFHRRLATGAAAFNTLLDNGVECPVIHLCLFPGIVSSGAFYHEYVHYQQWVRGDLGFTHDDKGRPADMTWQGESVNAFSNTDLRDYMDQPWEKEAHEKQYAFLHLAGHSIVPPKWALAKRSAYLHIAGTLISWTKPTVR